MSSIPASIGDEVSYRLVGHSWSTRTPRAGKINGYELLNREIRSLTREVGEVKKADETPIS
ncbi:MAG TPA: hypothetical protein VMO47_11115 [Rhodothermales bacterium]|nr:hypothetical protein [Rhodothermales bacterium]